MGVGVPLGVRVGQVGAQLRAGHRLGREERVDRVGVAVGLRVGRELERAGGPIELVGEWLQLVELLLLLLLQLLQLGAGQRGARGTATAAATATSASG